MATLREYVLKKLSISGFALQERDDLITAWPRGSAPEAMSLAINAISKLTPEWLLSIKIEDPKQQETEMAVATARRFVQGTGQFRGKRYREFFARSLNRWVAEYMAGAG